MTPSSLYRTQHHLIHTSVWLRLCLVLALVIPTAVFALTPEEMRKAAKAAETTRGLYETGGRADTPAFEAQKLKQASPTAHIQDADKKVATKKAKERARQRATEEAEVRKLVSKLKESRVHHAKLLKGLQSEVAALKSQLAQAKRDKTTAEANLASHRKGLNVLEKLLPDDRRTNHLNSRILGADARSNTLAGQLALREEAFTNAARTVTGYERRMELEVIKVRRESRNAEQSRRREEATELARDYHTQQAQIEASKGTFEAKIKEYDNKIAKAKRLGFTDDVTKFERDKQKTIDTHEAWNGSQQSTLKANFQALKAVYDKNRTDGIGPTSTEGLKSELRRAARSSGKDPEAAVDFVDKSAVKASATSAGTIAEAAHRSTDHTSIFNEISSESVHDFFLDLKEDKLTWTEFSLRMGSYTKGAARGTKDAVVDLLKLVKEVGDTAGETFEAEILKRLGIQSNVFGRENLELLKKLATQGAILIDPDNPEGAKLAKKLVGMAEQMKRMAERKVEKTAARGNTRKALEGVGYIAATVVGPEAAVIEGVVVTAKLVGKGAKLLTGSGKVDELAKGAGALDKGTDAARASEATAKGTRTRTGGATRTSKADTPKIKDIELIIDPDPPINPITELPESGLVGGTITLADGRKATLVPDNRLGEGSFSTAFTAKTPDGKVITAPDGKPLVIKVTNNKADGMDAVGYKGLEGIDPNVLEVPRVHSSTKLGDGLGDNFSGGSVHVVDEGPKDFKKFATDGSQDAHGRTAYKPMSAGQAIAFDEAMRALNKKGWVWLDNKPDNYAFRNMGGDKWKLVIIDPGGLVPVKGLDPKKAREIQKFIDNPDWQRSTTLINDLTKKSKIAEKFNGDIDFDLINRLTGGKYDTLGPHDTRGIPFNPQNGTLFPKTNQLAGVDDPAELAKLQERLRKAQAASGGTEGTAAASRAKTGTGTPAAGDGTAPTRIDGKQKPKEKGSTAKESAAKTERTTTGGKKDKKRWHQKGPSWDGKKRNPVRDFDKDKDGGGASGGGAGSGTEISVGGGFDGFPVAPPIYFEFGPDGILDWTGISTSCPNPCQYLVNEYIGLLNSPLTGDDLKQRLDLIKNTALPACEAFYCNDSDDLIGWGFELIRVIGLLGNNPYDTRDPLNPDSSVTTATTDTTDVSGGSDSCAGSFLSSGTFVVDGPASCNTGSGTAVCGGSSDFTFLSENYVASGSGANSTNTNINLPGLGPGHECGIYPFPGDNTKFQLYCNVTANPLIFCFQNYRQ